MKRNNKGAAMVSVLIACFFIGLLATSLLAMATMNYMAKSMRYSSTDNFYTAEFGLADLSTTLQNISAQCATVAEAATHVRTACKADSAAVTSWDRAKLTALITNATQDYAGSTGSIWVDYTEKYDTNHDGVVDVVNYKEGSDYVILYGVRIIAISESGFQSVISTDLKLNFQSISSPMDVNDFSVITDSPITVQGRSLLWAGHVFIGRGTTGGTMGGNGSYGGTPALTVGTTSKSTNVYIMNKGIIAGDIVVNPGSVLDISGEVTVYGKIDVKPGGTLIVSGTLHHTGDIIHPSGADVKGVYTTTSNPHNIHGNIFTGDRTIPTTGIEDDRLCHALLVDIDSEDGSFHLSLDTYTQSNQKVDMTTILNSTTYHSVTAFNGGHQFSNTVGNGMDNALILAQGTATLKKSFNNTTILAEGELVYDDQQNGFSTYMTCMGDDEYEACKRLMLYGNAGGYSFAGTNGGVMMPDTCPAGATEIVITEPNLLEGKEGRSIYKAGSTYYVPFGYFINEDSPVIIGNAFAASMGEQDPKNSYVVYSNWDKL